MKTVLLNSSKEVLYICGADGMVALAIEDQDEFVCQAVLSPNQARRLAEILKQAAQEAVK